MTTVFDSSRSVKSESFGHGIQPDRRRPFVPSIEDLNWAAQFFGTSNRPPAGRAGRRGLWYHRFDDTMPLSGHCLNCGDRCDDLTFQGLCDRCDTLATEDTIACVNQLHGLGRRVF